MLSRKNRRLGWLFVGLIFALNVVIRYDHLSDPIGMRGFQWLSGHTLITLRIWSQEGAIGEHAFLPIMTWPGETNRHVVNYASQEGADGRRYYTSYPMLGFILPYLAIRPFDAEISIFSLRVFSLVLTLLCGSFAYAIVVHQTYGPQGARIIGGVVAAATYMLLPITLWFHCHTYFVDMLAQPLMLAGIYLAVRTFRRPDTKQRWAHGLSLLVFALVLTEWIGVLFAFAVWLYALVVYRGSWRKYFLTGLPITCAAGIMLTVAHFSLIDGPGAFVETTYEKYRQRSGIADSTRFDELYQHRLWSLEAWSNLLKRYWGDFRFALMCAAVSAVAWIGYGIQRGRQLTHRRYRGWMLPLYLATLPLLLHHLILFQFTVQHGHALLKACTIFSLAAGFLTAYAVEVLLRNRADHLRLLKVSGLLACCMWLVAYNPILLYLNSRNLEVDERFETFGHTIQRIARDNEVVFLEGTYANPQIVLYAERNVAPFDDETMARELMDRIGAERGILFRADDRTFKIEDFQRFSLDDGAIDWHPRQPL